MYLGTDFSYLQQIHTGGTHNALHDLTLLKMTVDHIVCTGIS